MREEAGRPTSWVCTGLSPTARATMPRRPRRRQRPTRPEAIQSPDLSGLADAPLDNDAPAMAKKRPLHLIIELATQLKLFGENEIKNLS